MPAALTIDYLSEIARLKAERKAIRVQQRGDVTAKDVILAIIRALGVNGTPGPSACGWGNAVISRVRAARWRTPARR